jgi:hypothetical protein
MDELVKLVASKVGISEAQAQQAVEIVLGFLQDKLPQPWGSHLDKVIEGDLSGLGDLGDMASGLGGLLGKK